MLVEPDAKTSLGHDRAERCLSDFKRIAPQIVANCLTVACRF
jgi:hypothetical protein